MMLYYLLAFSRVVIGLIFLVSFAGKALNSAAFEQTILSFRLIPSGLARIVAWIFLLFEFLVVVLILAGGVFLPFAFLLATALLFVFNAALCLALSQQLQISCNCFGPTQKLVSIYDVIRNVGIILCAIVGYSILTIEGTHVLVLTMAEWSLVVVTAVVFTAVWLHVREIVQLFRQN